MDGRSSRAQFPALLPRPVDLRGWHQHDAGGALVRSAGTAPCVCVRSRRSAGSSNGSPRAVPARRWRSGRQTRPASRDARCRRPASLGRDSSRRLDPPRAPASLGLFASPRARGNGHCVLYAIAHGADPPNRVQRSPDPGQRAQRADVLDWCDHRAIGRRRHSGHGQPRLGDPRRCTFVCRERLLARSSSPRASSGGNPGLLLCPASTRVARVLGREHGSGRPSWWRQCPT